jgi:hypothetical protein
LIDNDNFYQLKCDIGSFDKKSTKGAFLNRDTKTTVLPVSTTDFGQIKLITVYFYRIASQNF